MDHQVGLKRSIISTLLIKTALVLMGRVEIYHETYEMLPEKISFILIKIF